MGVSPDGVLGTGGCTTRQTSPGCADLRDGPHWDIDYVEFHRQHVLIITVAPPQPGHRIHSLVKDYESYSPELFSAAASPAPSRRPIESSTNCRTASCKTLGLRQRRVRRAIGRGKLPVGRPPDCAAPPAV